MLILPILRPKAIDVNLSLVFTDSNIYDLAIINNIDVEVLAQHENVTLNMNLEVYLQHEKTWRLKRFGFDIHTLCSPK